AEKYYKSDAKANSLANACGSADTHYRPAVARRGTRKKDSFFLLRSVSASLPFWPQGQKDIFNEMRWGL
ncbi:hypothetical protein TNIN_474911, partial [Trichonephila inaurata madagascariensis]